MAAPFGVTFTALQNFQSQAASLVNFHHVDRYVLGPQFQQLFDRFLPTAIGLMRQSGNQIEAEIAKSRGAQNFRCLENIGATVHPARGAQFGVVEGLDAHADAVESSFPPRGCFFGGDGFRIGFERHFLELRDGNDARIASMICARFAGSRRLGVPPPR